MKAERGGGGEIHSTVGTQEQLADLSSPNVQNVLFHEE